MCISFFSVVLKKIQCRCDFASSKGNLPSSTKVEEEEAQLSKPAKSKPGLLITQGDKCLILENIFRASLTTLSDTSI